jgi:hypothetical protein
LNEKLEETKVQEKAKILGEKSIELTAELCVRASDGFGRLKESEKM